MRRIGIIGLLLVVGLVLAIEFVPIYVYIWDGGYELTIHIDSPGGPPAAIGCVAEGTREAAEYICKRWPAPRAFEQGGYSTVANPYEGQPLKVQIGLSGRDSAFGRELARSQHRYLVVSAEWPDGQRICKVVEIPDGRVSREMRVSVP